MSAARIRELRAARTRLFFVQDFAELSPPIRKTIEQDRKQGLGWRHDGLSGWSTDDIFVKLRGMAVDTSPRSFPEQAEQAGSVVALAASWSSAEETSGPWSDFPLVAADELWCRLLSEVDCPEVVSRRLDEVVLAGCSDHIRIPTEEAERAHLRRSLADFLGYVARGDPQTRQTRYADAQSCSPIDYETLLLELIKQATGDELGEVAAMASEMVRAKPNPLALGYLGIAFARAGKDHEAMNAVDRNRADHPMSAWADETAGEVHLMLRNAENTIVCFQRALQRAESALEWGTLLDRMCTAASTHAPDPSLESIVTAALDRLADEVPPPED